MIDSTDEKGDTLVAISGANFGWVPGKPDILNDITVGIRRFTFVVGPVGSGKSTLMRAILGEVPLQAGSIHADPGNIAQCQLRCGMTVLLEDVFAGQDAATEEHVLRNLFAETGLFQQMSITMVCVTNAIHRLAYADLIVALDVSGHIVHQGSFAQLRSDTDYPHGLAVEQNGAIDTQDAADASVQHRHETVPRGRYEQDAEQDSDDSESPGRVLGEFATYAYYFGSVPVWHTILLAVLTILYTGSYRMTALVLSFWTDTTEGSGQATNDYCLGLLAKLTGLAVLGITGAAYLFLVVMVASSSEVLHARLLHSVMNTPVAFFSRTDVEVTTNRFSQDMSAVDTELPFALIIMSVILIAPKPQLLHQLKRDDVVDRLGGLDSPLDADRLSQGRRQLLCIARAMLAGKRIVLIDEASSNVDERSERLIRDVMRVIAVAHRLGAVVDFDRVAVMGGGRLLEWDCPPALVKRDSEFKRLWDLGAG
ncbi:hypothetical protein DTO006G1_2650 [Penicillium roqueforti]|nr:hypothetical protein CBS147337_2668 [Penicillium roqueforti]KAI2690216.1 hypothetical protein CBS147355_667 [Penicillium roqueforti]KAI2695216.1 hypothetical protein CBS147372_9344 [Penicillium roqueforti]KAI2762713.1 hypothetical protein DTO006G1_2650 [Penicillium roqueforti]KAI3114625.1 hypothetical protein CBS147333_1780 [Penicillium roqueforti]